MKRYREHYADVSFLLKKIDNPAKVIEKYVKSRLNMYHHELVDEIPSIEEINQIERNIIKCFAALYVFMETIDDLRYASARRIGSIELAIHMSDICDSHITENISLYRKALEKSADKLARYSEHILFEEPIEVTE